MGAFLSSVTARVNLVSEPLAFQRSRGCEPLVFDAASIGNSNASCAFTSLPGWRGGAGGAGGRE